MVKLRQGRIRTRMAGKGDGYTRLMGNSRDMDRGEMERLNWEVGVERV